MKPNQDDCLLNEAQVLLDGGFQECLDLTAALQRTLNEKAREQVGSQSLPDKDIVSYLSAFSRRLYEVVATTLFRLISTLQPEDCRDNQPINFYFWPGYHSYLADQRIFIRKDAWNLGVGIYETPQAKTLHPYDDCSQARWYQYLIRPRNKSAVVPIDIHRMLLNQSAAEMATSLLVTTKPSDYAQISHRLLRLTPGCGKTEEWGRCLRDFVVHGDERQVREIKAEEVSDPFVSRAKARMQSLWLHSAMCDFEPEWLHRFIGELGAREDTKAASLSLENALSDQIAKDWGDKETTGRPPFCSWINFSLRAWLDPQLDQQETTNTEYEPATNHPDKLAKKTVGSAAFLCSLPIRPRYFAFARSWVNEVYNTVRNAEITMVFHNKDLGAREAMAAGPYFAHEIQKIVDQGLTTAQREFADDREEAVLTRRFVLYSIRTLCNLAYSFTNAVMTRDTNALRNVRDELVNPLRDLRQDGLLLSDLTTIANDIYKSVKRKEGGTVTFPNKGEMPVPPDEKQHGVCFLLVAEMLRNYCQSQESGSEADFRTWLDHDTLLIELEGPTRAQRYPASMSFARLDVFLRTLGIGQANTRWDKDMGSCTFTVIVNLGPQIL